MKKRGRGLALILSACLVLGNVQVVAAAEVGSQEISYNDSLVASVENVGEGQDKVLVDNERGASKKAAIIDASGETVETINIDLAAAYSGLQSALDYARDNGSAKNIMTIKLPAGTYKVNGTLDMYGSTTLDLSSGAVIKRQGDGSLMRFGRSEESSKGYTGYQNIKIIGSASQYGVFDGSEKSVSILRFAHAQNVTMQYIEFTNVKSAHHMEFAGSRNIVIDHCKFTGFTLAKPKDTTNYEAIQIDILNEAHFPNYEKYDNTVSADITVTNNVFDGTNRGVGSHSAEVGRYFNNINISNNTFTNNNGYAIVATNYKNAKINNNKIVNCGSGIAFRHISPDYQNYYEGNKSGITANLSSEIMNNTISVKSTTFDNTRYGIRVYGEKLSSAKKVKEGKKTITIPAGDYRVKNVKIQGNKITSPVPCNAIWLQGVINSEVSMKNVITYKTTKKLGASADCDGIKIEKSKGITVSNNTIEDKSGSKAFMGNAIYVKDKSKEIDLMANSISNCREAGICINLGSAAGKIKNNTITKTGDNGIYVNTGSSAAKIQKNKIYDVKKHGIYINSSTVTTVSGNKVAKKNNKTSSVRGICVNGSKASVKTISANNLSKCSEHGIMCNDGATAKTITGNTIKNVARNGIYSNLNAKVTTITQNTVSGAKNVGIAVYSNKVKVTVTGNKLTSCGAHGIDFCQGVKGTEKGNKFSKCKNNVRWQM